MSFIGSSPRLRLLPVALLIASMLMAAVAPARSATAAGDCTVSAAMDGEEQQFLVLINNYRAQNGLPSLALSYTLTKASAWKSADMAANRYFAHDDLNRTWVQRVQDCGYGFNTWLGENIAAGVTTAQQAFDIWRNSPGHNANMLSANYHSIGIGRYYAAGSPYGWYWTTDFGGFDDGYSSIAAGAALPVPASPTATRRHAKPAGRGSLRHARVSTAAVRSPR